ncbi:response regulator transcription factor [Sphingobacterium thalpophilum]|uniref:response regulator transcription factor n=1 Tax=Sphingobacterium thalpophilum TaxID=259 RepID=UPI003D98EDA5
MKCNFIKLNIFAESLKTQNPITMNLRCYVVDDEMHGIINITNLIQQTEGVEFVGSATKPLIALNEILHLKPDVVFTDYNMSEMDGVTLAGHIDDFAQVVIISGQPQDCIKGADWSKYIYRMRGVDFREFQSIMVEVEKRMESRKVKM